MPEPVPPPPPTAPPTGKPVAPHYRAFISYAHADTKWATWLMRRLEIYRVPDRFHGRIAPIGAVGARISPVFRDRDELPTSDDLGNAVQEALEQSATLVVICSPAAARSRWVNEEALHFKRLGRSDRVFALIVDGEPGAKDPGRECFPPALRFAVGTRGALSDQPVEMIAADARPHADGRDDAFIRLVAGLLGVGFDDLRQREHVRRMRRMMWITAGSVSGMAITAGLALYAMKARNDALIARNDAQRRQQQMENFAATMLNDMTTGLQKAEKLDALEAAGTRIMTYFQALNPRDLTDATLAQQAKALTQIGEIRSKQLRYPEAEAAFAEAFKRLAALVDRHPQAGDMLFERAQAEFWIGNMHYKRGDFAQAVEWLQRYRDSGIALAALNPANRAWQREAISGLHNLAALEYDRGNLAAARAGFLRELAVLQKVAAENPQDRPSEFSVANIVSFLGSVAERSGDLAEARERFAEQTRLLEALAAKEPLSPRWQERLANALGLEATIFEISGQPDAAVERRRRSRAMLESLVAKDPANRVWSLGWLRSMVREGDLLRMRGDAPAAERLGREALSGLAKLAETESGDRMVAGVLASGWRLEARLRDAEGRPDASAAAARALAIGEELFARGRANEDLIGGLVQSCVVAGRIAGHQGDQPAARRAWQRAVVVAETRLGSSKNWSLLDPAARALALLGRSDESRAIVERLTQSGYRPLEPWPAAGVP